jgi:hypothetical protein
MFIRKDLATEKAIKEIALESGGMFRLVSADDVKPEKK